MTSKKAKLIKDVYLEAQKIEWFKRIYREAMVLGFKNLNELCRWMRKNSDKLVYTKVIHVYTPHISSYPYVSARRLVRTDFISPQEKDGARDRGEFYIEEGKGETTTLESYRLDTTTRNQLKLMEKWSPKIMDKQLTQSDLIRLAIHNLFKEWDRQVKGQS